MQGEGMRNLNCPLHANFQIRAPKHGITHDFWYQNFIDRKPVFQNISCQPGGKFRYREMCHFWKSFLS